MPFGYKIVFEALIESKHFSKIFSKWDSLITFIILGVIFIHISRTGGGGCEPLELLTVPTPLTSPSHIKIYEWLTLKFGDVLKVCPRIHILCCAR